MLTLASAVLIFCIVQDYVTANGADRYVSRQREAMAGRVAPGTIDEVMRPAVEQSVQQGLIWGGVVLMGGLGVAAVLGSPRLRERARFGGRRV